MSALPESSTRMALASPVTWTSSTSRPSIHPFFWATRYGSENVVTGPGKDHLDLGGFRGLRMHQQQAALPHYTKALRDCTQSNI